MAKAGPSLILASTSPYRRALLERLGVPFDCIAPGVDEEAIRDAHPGLSPVAIAGKLSRAKAEAVARMRPGAVVIGSDQLVAVKGEILGKPGSLDKAAAQLRKLSGRTHELVTAVSVVHGDDLREFADLTYLRMRTLEDAAIARYLAADEPWDCAGSYKIEARGIAMFERVDSQDQSAIVGLPLIGLTTILRDIGFLIP